MAYTRYAAVVLLGGAFALASPPLLAEEGDYGFFQTLRNLVSPPRANNPVQPAQRQGQYPLLSRDAAKADGFSPGAYYQWQTVNSAETGAVCGNGSPIQDLRQPRARHHQYHHLHGRRRRLLGLRELHRARAASAARAIRTAFPTTTWSLLNPGASLVSPFS